jgi:hypothetical protein
LSISRVGRQVGSKTKMLFTLFHCLLCSAQRTQYWMGARGGSSSGQAERGRRSFVPDAACGRVARCKAAKTPRETVKCRVLQLQRWACWYSSQDLCQRDPEAGGQEEKATGELEQSPDRKMPILYSRYVPLHPHCQMCVRACVSSLFPKATSGSASFTFTSHRCPSTRLKAFQPWPRSQGCVE